MPNMSSQSTLPSILNSKNDSQCHSHLSSPQLSLDALASQSSIKVEGVPSLQKKKNSLTSSRLNGRLS